MQQARQILFDRHVSALKAKIDLLWTEKYKKAGVAAQVSAQAPAPTDVETTEAVAQADEHVEAEVIEEPVELSRQELNQLNTLTEIEVAYIHAVYQSEYAGGEDQGKKNMLDMPKDMMDTVKSLVSYFSSRSLSLDLDKFLSPAEQKQLKVLLTIYTEHTTQARQAHIEHWQKRLAAEKEYQRAKAQQAGKAGKGREARPQNIPVELQHAFHREIPSDALQMAQNPGGFLIKSGRGEIFAIQIAEALSGKPGSTWEVYVVSDGGSQYVQEGQTFELGKKSGHQGDRLEMKGMNPVIAQGLETFVSVVGVGSLSQDLKAFYDAHMKVKQARTVQKTFKPRRAPEQKPVRTSR